MAYNVQIDQTDLGGPFPGGSPCDATHHFEIQYQKFEYDGRDNSNVNLKFTQNTTYGPKPFGSNQTEHNTTAY
eukprot:gene14573-22884_t